MKDKNRKMKLASRYLLALPMLMFGLDKFFHFMKMPTPPEAGGAFLGALGNAGYVFPAIGVIFLLVAASMISGRAITLALLILAPVLFHILAYHLRFDPAGIAAGLIVAVLAIAVSVLHREKVKSIFQ